MSKILGRCPRCGAEYVDGYYGPYCTGKCGFRLRRVLGRDLSGEQISALLKGEKVLLKDLASRRTGKLYSMYVQAQEVEEYSYQNRFGEDVTGYRFRYSMTFPDRDEKDAGETMRPASGSAERAFSCNGCDPAEAARGGGSESGFEKSAARSDMTNTSAWEGEELPFR